MATGDIIFDGEYLVGREHPLGMQIEPTDEGKEFAEALVRDPHKSTVGALGELFEDWLGGEWMWVDQEQLGALTDAPIISRDASFDDSGDLVLHGPGIVYAHMNYAVEDPIAEWSGGKGVVWDRYKIDVAKYQKTEEDLKLINRHRRSLGMHPLDPERAGWGQRDIELEAQRIRQLQRNPAYAKHRLLAYDFGGAANPVTPPGMPLHPTNTILVRLNASGRAEMGPADLYVWLLYMFNRGYYRPLACGTCQQCIRLRDVKNVPIEGGRKLKHIATLRSGVDPDKLRVGDVLLQRVGTVEGCGRPYIVVGTSPLSTRGHGFRGGRAAGRSPADFDPVQLERGTLVEMEHTASRRLAQRIAMDHLAEHPDYYVELAKMEAMLRERRRAGNPWIGIQPGRWSAP
jgi:hypothetical protein